MCACMHLSTALYPHRLLIACVCPSQVVSLSRLNFVCLCNNNSCFSLHADYFISLCTRLCCFPLADLLHVYACAPVFVGSPCSLPYHLCVCSCPPAISLAGLAAYLSLCILSLTWMFSLAILLPAQGHYLILAGSPCRLVYCFCSPLPLAISWLTYCPYAYLPLAVPYPDWLTA
jgi:hypothetical protein